MSTNGLWIRIEARNNETANWLERIICSIKGVKIQGSDDTRRANLLIYELGKDIQKEFLHIESLLHTKAVDEIFLTSVEYRPGRFDAGHEKRREGISLPAP